MSKDTLSKIRNGDVYKALERVLEAERIEGWTVEDCRPHPYIGFGVNGWKVKFHFACTPSTRGRSHVTHAKKLERGIEALRMEPGRGRELKINHHTAADVDNGRLYLDVPPPAPEPQPARGVVPFDFDGQAVRTVPSDSGEPWFVLADVCRILEISKHRDAAARLDPDERGSVVVDTLGGPQNVTIINESGLYSLILTSRKPEAKRFKRWVTSEVLPTIRKTGAYVATGAPQAIDYARIAEIASRAAADTVARILPEMMAHLAPRHPADTGLTAGEVMSLAGVGDRRGLRGPINAVSASLCEIHRQRGVTVHIQRNGTSSRKLFDPSVCRDWLATGGRDFIRQRVAGAHGVRAVVLALSDHRKEVAS
ncbi:BRO-N domain-containing protein [Amorphus sp. MBR-141]